MTDKQLLNFERGRALGAPLVGAAVKQKTAPSSCPRCGRGMAGRPWLSYLGHLGLHGLADRHFGGDLDAAQRRLMTNGLARQRPAPGAPGGALPAYQPIKGEG